jgi:hypothetical protein
VYVGTLLACRLVKSKEDTLVQVEEKNVEKVGLKDAMKFPFVASVFLIGFYLIYTYISSELVNLLLTIQFGITAVLTLGSHVEKMVGFPEGYRKVLKHVKPYKIIKSLLEI